MRLSAGRLCPWHETDVWGDSPRERWEALMGADDLDEAVTLDRIS